MTSQLILYKFNEIYDKTHLDLLKYVIIKCHNINDTSDIMQETYLELWNILNKKELSDINIKGYLISITNNKIKKHYTLLQKLRTVSLFERDDKDIELIDTIEYSVNIDDIIIKEDQWNIIWEYIKGKKNQDIPKVFYLYYKLELSIKEISNHLSSSESYIKHLIYRTLKELQDNFGNEGKCNDK